MLLRVRFNPVEQCGDPRECGANPEFIVFDFSDAAALFIEIAAQILPSIVVATVKIDQRREPAAEFKNEFFDGTEMHRFSSRDPQERPADSVIGDSLGMLAKAHHMLHLSDVAMAQHFEGAIARVVRVRC